MNRRLWLPLAAMVVFAAPILTGCKRGQGPPPQMPVPSVTFVTVKAERVVLTSELPGRTAGYLVAEIRPQVNGLLQKRLFTEGADVKAGQVLYQIDPAPYQAAYNNATANLAAAREAADRAEATLRAGIASLKRHEATLKLAKTNLARYEKLVETQAVSAMQRDEAEAAVEVADSGLRVAEAQMESDREAVSAAKAAIQQAEAAVETAKINLGYTKIIAPIDGRIGRSNITEGAIVTAYQPVALATIQQFDPIFVDVTQSTVELNRLKRSLANGRLLKGNGTDHVKIVLEDGTPYPHDGSLKFRDVTVDPTTGSVILRIVVPNPDDDILLPGMFVRAIIDEGINDRAILVPQQAVMRNPKGEPYVMTVESVKGKNGSQDVAKPRPITVDRALGDKWLVTSGLEPGDRVIVVGILGVQQLQQMMPDVPEVVVKATPFKAGGPPTAKPGGPAKKNATKQ